jgi:hypothetical protein
MCSAPLPPESRPFARGEARLGRNDDCISHPTFLDEGADHLLAAAAGIDVSRVDEVVARIYVSIEDFARSVLALAPTSGAEGHSPERQRADDKAGAAKSAIVVERHDLGFPRCFISIDRTRKLCPRM